MTTDEVPMAAAPLLSTMHPCQLPLQVSWPSSSPRSLSSRWPLPACLRALAAAVGLELDKVAVGSSIEKAAAVTAWLGLVEKAFWKMAATLSQEETIATTNPPRKNKNHYHLAPSPPPPAPVL
uniref:Uncharacterized protein n=1 Tax=Oryza meridionalis TaxID=40149 RepID=A0A0E0DM68_9ORYZ